VGRRESQQLFRIEEEVFHPRVVFLPHSSSYPCRFSLYFLLLDLHRYRQHLVPFPPSPFDGGGGEGEQGELVAGLAHTGGAEGVAALAVRVVEGQEVHVIGQSFLPLVLGAGGDHWDRDRDRLLLYRGGGVLFVGLSALA
jgi:hypothetical protein